MINRAHYTNASSLAIAAVSAAFILFPSIFAVINPPVVHSWALWSFFLFGLVAYIFLIWTYYIATFTDDGLPIRASGIGSLSALACLLSFAAFLFLNIYQDQTAKPRIVSITASAYKAEAGDIVAFTGEASDESGDAILWQWCIAPAAPKQDTQPVCLKSNLKSATWQVPARARPGLYRVEALASDGPYTSEKQMLEIQLWTR